MPDTPASDSLDRARPRDLLVVRLSAIGDTCHALAVVRNLADNWPDARITWIIGKTEASLMADVDGIEFIIFDKRKGFAAYRDVARRLRGRHFDAALCMHASLRVNLLYPFIRSPAKVGFDKPRARDFQWLFTNQRIDATKGRHVLEAMMSFARKIGAADRPLRWDIPVSDKERAFASGLRNADLPLVVISPCSSQRSRNFRNWSAGNFAAVARHIVENHRGTVVVTGGNSSLEQEYGAAIADNAERTVDLSGKTSLKELFALIAEADLVVCPDSGPAHMATAAGTPVVGLYATSNPGRTGPYLSQQHTVNRYPDAAARFLGKTEDDLHWGQRVRSPDAMDLIRIDEVCSKIDEILLNSSK